MVVAGHLENAYKQKQTKRSNKKITPDQSKKGRVSQEIQAASGSWERSGN